MKRDDSATVAELKEAVGAFIDARDWSRYHTPKNLAMSIAIEAAEIMEHFQWTTVEEARASMEDPDVKAKVEEEIADVNDLLPEFRKAYESGRQHGDHR